MNERLRELRGYIYEVLDETRSRIDQAIYEYQRDDEAEIAARREGERVVQGGEPVAERAPASELRQMPARERRTLGAIAVAAANEWVNRKWRENNWRSDVGADVPAPGRREVATNTDEWRCPHCGQGTITGRHGPTVSERDLCCPVLDAKPAPPDAGGSFSLSSNYAGGIEPCVPGCHCHDGPVADTRSDGVVDTDQAKGPAQADRLVGLEGVCYRTPDGKLWSFSDIAFGRRFRERQFPSIAERIEDVDANKWYNAIGGGQWGYGPDYARWVYNPYTPRP